MLVLSRKHNETIQIGDDVFVTMVRIGPNSCRIGITAPKHVKIIRTEMKKETANQQETAVVS